MGGKIHTRDKHNGELVPALDLTARYSSRLSARSALYTDLRLLLDGLNEALPSVGYRSLVIGENRLARSSVSARQKVWKELKPRYLLDRDHPLFDAFWAEWQRCDSERERELTAYILFALNDRLVADLGMEWLFPYLRRAPAEIRVEDVQGFLDRAARHHSEVASWSTETHKHISRHYMASIRDFGLARGKLKKTTLRPALYGAPMRLLVRTLRLARLHPLKVVQARIFRLLALDGSEVIDALGELNRIGGLHFRMQGDVVELDLRGEAR